MSIESQNNYALRNDFRYFHEPIPEELSNAWVVGRNSSAQELADRIMLSRGGAFLVSGLRGVGKTTCVRLAIHVIRANRERFARLGGDFEVVDVWINLARPLAPVQLLHHLIRHLYLRLKEMQILDRLDPALREDLKTAFLRTSFEISSRSLIGEERQRGSEVGFGKAPWLGLEFLGKISHSYKQSRSDEEALKYLPYDEKAAEFEILSFSRRLLDGLRKQPTSRWRHWWHRLRRIKPSAARVKVVFVLDELDKLEPQDAESAKSPLDPILQALKSVFTASGFSFVFIGGKEVEERLLEDVSRGDSIYESIFAYDLYLPCLWKEQNDIVLRCFDPNGSAVSEKENTVSLYLRYKGRGVPRRTWRELNKHVVWNDRGPVLALDLDRRRYMQVFAKVEEALLGERAFQNTHGVVDQVRRDRQRLCFYYTMDWIFARGREPFSVAQLTEIVGTFNLGRANAVFSPSQIARSVVNLLLSRAFIERADLERTLIGNIGDANTIYRLSPWVLLAFQGSVEAQWVPEEAVSPPPPDTELEKIGRYRVVQKIGEGGFASVYRVTDVQGRSFAAKILHVEATAGPAGAALFEQEVAALRMMEHPGVPRLYDSGVEHGRSYLIMDILEGVSLRQLLDSLKNLPLEKACAIALELTNVFEHIHQHGIARLDIKPSNIFLTDQGEVKVLDLGIATFVNKKAKVQDATSSVTLLVGTPSYMAPEQIVSGKADARSDIFALGVVLVEMITGTRPFRSDSGIPEQVRSDDLPLIATEMGAIPPGLLSAIQTSLSRDPGGRFPTMEAFGKALAPFAEGHVREMVKHLRSMTRQRKLSSKEATATAIPIQTIDAPALPLSPDQKMPELIQLLRSSDLPVQQVAFARLCTLSSPDNATEHLLFDLDKKFCLWRASNQVSTIPLKGESLKLGRSAPEVDLLLLDASVSRQHVAFFPSAKSVDAEDLSSANGTLLNGKRLRRETLKDGDLLIVGNRKIAIHLLAASEQTV